MKKQLFAIATGLTLGAAALMAQADVQPLTLGFQSVSTMNRGGGAIVTYAGGGGGVVTGSPMSAKEVNKTVQTLSDGTEIENTHATMFYRDSQGRTRTEPVGTDGPITITDPVAGVRITIMPATKTAIRTLAPALTAGARGGSVTSTFSYTTSSGSGDSGVVALKVADEVKALAELRATAAKSTTVSKNQSSTEDLGMLMQNGLMAQGTRNTLTIPQGQIGNNRDIHVINERWYSKDLQMLVKSTNTDPRYGVTTYELQNISLNAPDPTLFQIPTGFTVTEGGRGGRGGMIVAK